MRHVWGLCVWPAIVRGSLLRRLAPFALALVITAGGQVSAATATLSVH